MPTREKQRLEDMEQGRADWHAWGRTWASARGTVHEDYSADGSAWE